MDIQQHIKWLNRFESIQKFFKMIYYCGAFHFDTCDWIVHKKGPDTCNCTIFMMNLYDKFNS